MSDTRAVPTTAPTAEAPKAVPAAGRVLQRACACGRHSGNGGECAECRKKRLGLQRLSLGRGPDVAPPIVHDVLRSAGRPLDEGTRGFMESRFGQDFSGVRVHTDARAAESARAVNALAYTVGNHVAFGAGQFAPGTSGGRGLLAHELAHVVQQGASWGGVGGMIRIDDGGERSAIAHSRRALGAQSGLARAVAAHPASGAPALQRQAAPAAQGYTISLRPGLSIENAPLDRAQRFMRSQVVELLRGYTEGKQETHQFLINLREHHWIVGPISEALGGVSMPPLSIWNFVFAAINDVAAAVDAGEIQQALDRAVMAEQAYAEASQQIANYRQGIETGGERAVTGLEFIRTASVVVVGAGATVLTGGAGGAAVGALYQGTLTTAQQATESGIGLRREIDWQQIGFDTLLSFVLAYLGGRLARGLGNYVSRLVPGAASLGGQVVTYLVGSVIIGRGAALVATGARSVYALARGEQITPEQFTDRLAAQLTLNAVLMDMVYGAIAAATAAVPTGRAGSGGEDLPLPPALPEPATQSQGSRPALELISSQPSVASAPLPSGGAVRGKLALAELPQVAPPARPLLQLVPPAPAEPVVVPQAVTTTAPASSLSALGTAVGVGAALGSGRPGRRTSGPAPFRMRFQIQWNSKSQSNKNKGEFSETAEAYAEPGVTVAQAIIALDAAHNKVAPGRAKTASQRAVERQRRRIRAFPPGGWVVLGGRTSKSEPFPYDYPDARVDINNLQGHNLKV